MGGGVGRNRFSFFGGNSYLETAACVLETVEKKREKEKFTKFNPFFRETYKILAS